MTSTPDPIAEQAAIADTWRKLHWSWYGFFYALSFASIFLSTLVASKPAGLGWSEDFYGVLAWILAVVTASLTLFRPQQRATRYRQGWMLLDLALDKQRLLGGSAEDVFTAREAGERLIHQSQD